MDWWDVLDNDRGSQPRCILLVDGTRKDVAERLTGLVDVPGVIVSHDDKWMPYGKPVWRGYWDDAPSKEARLDTPNILEDKFYLLKKSRRELKSKKWWLANPKGRSTPNWDIASTCAIHGRPGLLLAEAKAHGKELKGRGDKSGATGSNRRSIGEAIIEANNGLKQVTAGPWHLSRDSHYQVSNRFAWAWKLATLGIPVVLVYLGFRNAQDMCRDGPLFSTDADWERILRGHCKGIVDNACWNRELDIAGTPLIPLIRTFDQPFP